MNKRIKALINKMTVEQAIIYDHYTIDYFIDHKYDVGERFIGLLIQKGKEPILFLNKLFNSPKNIHTVKFEDHEDPIQLLEPYLKDNLLGIDGNMPAKFLLPLINQGYHCLDISPCTYELRAIKDKDEIEKLSIASKLNDEIMGKIKKSLRLGMSELELSNKIQAWQAEAPLSGSSFPAIALFTENIADPHGIPSSRTLKEDDVVLIDMGGIFQGYCSDMTRCFFMSENKELEKLYKIVLEANLAAIASVIPGATLGDVDRAARSVIDKAGYGQYFVHRTGHGIGTEVHEFLDVAQNSTTIIEEGMCFSIEPGIYIEGLGGIRIEDLVCVERQGAKVLNKYPKTLDQITL